MILKRFYASKKDQNAFDVISDRNGDNLILVQSVRIPRKKISLGNSVADYNRHIQGGKDMRGKNVGWVELRKIVFLTLFKYFSSVVQFCSPPSPLLNRTNATQLS